VAQQRTAPAALAPTALPSTLRWASRSALTTTSANTMRPYLSTLALSC
jgi:hypothetical protein